MSKTKYNTYDLDAYKQDLDSVGLEKTWCGILHYVSNVGENDFLKIENFGELYEIGLAHTNKIAKKESGKYFTPVDVSNILCKWLHGLDPEKVADVCCGTGNLILTYLGQMTNEAARNLILDGRIYLYDIDPVALNICKHSIAIRYGKDCLPAIHCYRGDFLDRKAILPSDCKVISNPPYAHIADIKADWDSVDVATESKDFYAPIMDKIISQSSASVIITPYSFISGNKFTILRKHMDDHNGFIVSFDNVPANIFNGRKHGIFTSNTTNSVRAAITVVKNDALGNGFMLSPMIRFKAEERSTLLDCNVLESFVNQRRQRITNENNAYCKCFSSLDTVLSDWNNKADKVLGDYLHKSPDTDGICFPNSCRYTTVASVKDLDRIGKYRLRTSEYQNVIYCWLNSSFAYWYWRLYDGGINYSLSLLLSMPVYFSSLTDTDIKSLNAIAAEMQSNENQYLSYKKNASKMQENIKFPESYRRRIDDVFLKTLNNAYSNSLFDCVHSNAALVNNEAAREVAA